VSPNAASQEVHLRIAFGLAVLAFEIDRDVPIGTHLDGMGTPKIGRTSRQARGEEIEKGVGDFFSSVNSRNAASHRHFRRFGRPNEPKHLTDFGMGQGR